MPLDFLDRPFRMAMGLNRLEVADWLLPDQRFAPEIAQRAALLAGRRDDVLAQLTGMADAAAELHARLLDHLPLHHADLYRADGDGIVRLGDGVRFAAHPADPLLAVGHMVQEDCCLLRREGESYVLGAAALCFPSHWRLHDKLGKPMQGIHAPVPELNERLGAPLDRFFASLTPERPVWRANWSLDSSDELFQPGRSHAVPDIDVATAGDRLFLRAERQTLSRLPRSGAVVFTIRTYMRRVVEVAGEPVRAAALAARIREMPPAMAGYKAVERFRVPLLGWLDGRAAV